MKLKNLSSVILSAMMAATSVPAASLIAPYNSLSAYAVETAEPEAEAPIASGLCGENLTWEVFAEEDSLVIDGTGAMTEWENAEDAPWAEYGDRISLIVIRENVESVSENAFGATGGRIFYFDGFDCVIPDSETFLPENASIHGYDGSTAQAYAEKYGREFTSEGEYEAPSDENISTDENVPSDEEDSTVIEENRIVAEGMCGENLKWEIDSLEDILIISGYGEMTDWEKPEDAPWFEYSDEFDIVIIRPGVGELSENSLGSNAKIIYLESYNCVIPDSETAIPADAKILGYTGSTAQAYAEKYGREFDTLSGENEEYPLMEGVCTENLEWILWNNGSLSFYGYGDIVAENGVYPWDVAADSIKEVVINTAVKSIGENAFTNCTNLESVLMYTPDCKIADSADVFPSNVLLQVGDGSTAEEYAVKYNLTHVVYNFFTASGEIGDNLTWVLFNGGSLRIYGEGDMIDLGGVSPWSEYEDEITRVQIDEEVTSIDKSAFEGCDNIAEMIVLNPDCKFAESEDAIPEDTVIYAAEGSSALMYAQLFGRSFKTLSSEITTPEEEESPFVAEGKCGETLDWNIQTDKRLFINGDGVMDSYMGYSNWEEYTDLFDTVEYSGKLENYGEYAFYNCKNLKSIELAPVIGAHAFEGCSNIESIMKPAGFVLKEISDYAFYGCDNLGGLIIENPECVIADSPYVFPEDMTIFGVAGSTAQAHAEKYGLEFVDITETTVEMIADGELGENLSWNIQTNGYLNVFGNGDMIEIDGVYPWDEYAEQITEVFVSGNVTSISAGAFDDCVNASDVYVYNSECVIADVDNVFPANIQIICYENSSVHEYAEKYGYECFFWFEPDASGTIGNNLYWDLDEGNLNIYGNGDMIEIDGVYPWDEYAEQITYVTIQNDVTSISAGAFDDCANVEAVLIHNNDCVIADVDNVFPANTVIHGYAGSTAQAHAEKYNMKFEASLIKEIVSGELGDNLYWSVNENGILNVIGSGDMIEIDGVYPWDEFADEITDIYVGDYVTSISAGAFDDCVNAQEATVFNSECVIADVDNVFPENIQIICYENSSVHEYAEKYGYECFFLFEPDASGTIGNNLYWDLDEGNLNIYGNGDMIEIDGVYPWDEYAEQITEVFVSGNVTSISAGAFDDCANVEAVLIHNNDCVIADVDNVFPANTVIHGYAGSTAQAYAEKYNMKFEASLIKEIVSGELGDNLYWSVNENGILNVIGSGDMIEIDGVYPWDEFADEITDIYVGDYVTSISAGAFDDCVNAQEATVFNSECVIADADNVFPADTVIWGYKGSTAEAYAEKYGRTCVFMGEIDNDIIVSGELGEGFEWTIYDNGKITINGVGEMPEYEAGNYPWSDYSDMIKNISLAKEVTSIGAYAFYNCTNLIDVGLEDCINIGEHAFEGCENLSYIFIWGNENTIEIGDYAFYGCDALNNVFLRGDSFNIADSPNVFPEGVIIEGRCDGAKAYAEKYNIEYDDLSTKVEGNLTDTASWIIYNNNDLDIWGEGIIPDSDGYNPWSEYADDIKNIFINNEIVYIGDYAFYNCKNAETIEYYGVYSTEAHVIGNHAFDGCEKLKEFIAFYEFVEIGDYAFYNCDSMEDIFIYNPDCVIADSEFVFPANTVIHGYAGSTAQAHAEKYGLDFMIIEEESVTTTAPDSDSETTTTTTTTTTPNDSESELPQTGFSKAYDYLAFSAGVMALCGIYAMKKSKKKEDEE